MLTLRKLYYIVKYTFFDKLQDVCKKELLSEKRSLRQWLYATLNVNRIMHKSHIMVIRDMIDVSLQTN